MLVSVFVELVSATLLNRRPFLGPKSRFAENETVLIRNGHERRPSRPWYSLGGLRCSPWAIEIRASVREGAGRTTMRAGRA